MWYTDYIHIHKVMRIQTLLLLLLVLGILPALFGLLINTVDFISGSRVCCFLTMYMPLPQHDRQNAEPVTGVFLHPFSDVICVFPSILSNHTDSSSYF